MKRIKLRNVIFLVLLCNLILSCVTLQQPLPGSLWGNWAFVKTGTIVNGANERLYNYNNLCYKESDRLHFSSDKKMTLRWYDERCGINHIMIGRYYVENGLLKVNLENRAPSQNSPLPPITEYRIIQINSTTLKLEELPGTYRPHRKDEAMVFVFMKVE